MDSNSTSTNPSRLEFTVYKPTQPLLTLEGTNCVLVDFLTSYSSMAADVPVEATGRRYRPAYFRIVSISHQDGENDTSVAIQKRTRTTSREMMMVGYFNGTFGRDDLDCNRLFNGSVLVGEARELYGDHQGQLKISRKFYIPDWINNVTMTPLTQFLEAANRESEIARQESKLVTYLHQTASYSIEDPYLLLSDANNEHYIRIHGVAEEEAVEDRYY